MSWSERGGVLRELFVDKSVLKIKFFLVVIFKVWFRICRVEKVFIKRWDVLVVVFFLILLSLRKYNLKIYWGYDELW